LSEDQTIELMELVLECDPDLLTTQNAHDTTPTDVALLCEGKSKVQAMYTFVVFQYYQIVHPNNPIYKSSTTMVYECSDLRVGHSNDGTHQRFAIKLLAEPALWLRALQGRDKIRTPSVLRADSATVVLPDIIAEPPEPPKYKPKGWKPFVLPPSQEGYVCIKDYADATTTPERPITVLSETFVAGTRRHAAKVLMTNYPCVIAMPLADRTFHEIIVLERLAEEPLPVLREISTKFLNLIDALHEHGVIHGDIKPKNIVRMADGNIKLIDLNMAIIGGESGPISHQDPEKLCKTTAYAAPDLYQWMVKHKPAMDAANAAAIIRRAASHSAHDGAGGNAGGEVEAVVHNDTSTVVNEATVVVDTVGGTSPLAELATPQQIDLWAFAATLYEMATGSAVFENSYDKALYGDRFW
jgi:serine/threonine protein kinase